MRCQHAVELETEDLSRGKAGACHVVASRERLEMSLDSGMQGYEVSGGAPIHCKFSEIICLNIKFLAVFRLLDLMSIFMVRKKLSP